jgi:hypothetical protein
MLTSAREIIDFWRADKINLGGGGGGWEKIILFF